MPIYIFHCPTCKTAFEELVPSWRTPPPPCPGCGGESCQRKTIHPTSFRLAGDDWASSSYGLKRTPPKGEGKNEPG